jgi:dTDP-3-amino-3,4,6-trideoxy-alpha-D-glucose transaminase
VTDDPEVAGRARSLRVYGERERYVSVRHGWNSRLDELQAAVLGVRLPHLEGWIQRRRALAERYDEALTGRETRQQPEPAGFRHARHLYVVRCPDRDDLRVRLAERGIEALVHYPRAIHQHPAYAGLARQDLGESERLAAEVLSLPLYAELGDGEAEVVATALAETAV